MRRLLLVLTLFMFGCGKEGPAGQPGTSTAVDSVWEYSASICAGNYFGDGSNGCVIFAQLTKFTDGSAHVSFIRVFDVDKAYMGLSFYLKPGTTTFSKSAYDYLIATHHYKFEGDLSASPPTLQANMDFDGDFGNTAPKVFTLVQQ